jgi:hypothetical protein
LFNMHYFMLGVNFIFGYSYEISCGVT